MADSDSTPDNDLLAEWVKRRHGRFILRLALLPLMPLLAYAFIVSQERLDAIQNLQVSEKAFRSLQGVVPAGEQDATLLLGEADSKLAPAIEDYLPEGEARNVYLNKHLGRVDYASPALYDKGSPLDQQLQASQDAFALYEQASHCQHASLKLVTDQFGVLSLPYPGESKASVRTKHSLYWLAVRGEWERYQEIFTVQRRNAKHRQQISRQYRPFSMVHEVRLPLSNFPGKVPTPVLQLWEESLTQALSTPSPSLHNDPAERAAALYACDLAATGPTTLHHLVPTAPLFAMDMQLYGPYRQRRPVMPALYPVLTTWYGLVYPTDRHTLLTKFQPDYQPPELPPTNRRLPYSRFLLIPMTPHASAFDGLQRMKLDIQGDMTTRPRLELLSVRAERHRRKHKSWPSDLSTLAKFPSDIIDPVTKGAEFSWEIGDDGSFRIWSIRFERRNDRYENQGVSRTEAERWGHWDRAYRVVIPAVGATPLAQAIEAGRYAE